MPDEIISPTQMNILRDVSEWMEALTMSQIIRISGEIGTGVYVLDSNSTQSRDRSLVSTIIWDILGSYTNVESLMAYHHTLYPNREAFFINLPYTLSPLLPTYHHVYDERQAGNIEDDGRFCTRPSHAYRTLLYLVRNPDTMTIHTSEVVDMYANTAYGDGDICEMKHMWDWEPHDRDIDAQQAVSLDVIPPLIANRLLNIYASAHREALLFVKQYFETGVEPDIPSIAGITTYTVMMDTGSGSQGFPRLVYGNQWATFQTAPFGLYVEDPAYLIVSVANRTFEVYAQFYKPFTGMDMRNLQYWLADNMHIIPMIDQTTPYAAMTIMDLPVVANLLMHMDNIQPAYFFRVMTARVVSRRITEGSKRLLTQCLEENPVILDGIRVPSYTGLEYHIEDYITEQTWDALPRNVSMLCRAGKLVENPYTTLCSTTLDEILKVRNIGHIPPKQLYTQLLQYDIECPKWSDSILVKGKLFKDMPSHELMYYAAARNVVIPHKLQSDRHHVISVLLIVNGGGITETKSGSCPIDAAQINRIFCNVEGCDQSPLPCDHNRSREFFDNICRHFRILDYALMPSIHDIKRIFIRGYIGDDHLPPAIEERAKKWLHTSDSKRNILSKVYGICDDNRKRFITMASPNVYLEECIITMYKNTSVQIAEDLYMVIPPDGDLLTYMMRTIHLHGNLFGGKIHKSLVQMEDDEIISALNAVFHSTHREDLIAKAVKLLNGATGFFVPYVRTSTNTMTVGTGSPITKDMFTVSYGTLDKYLCYTLEELNEGFEPYGVENNERTSRILGETCEWIHLPLKDALSLGGLMAYLRVLMKDTPLDALCGSLINNVAKLPRLEA